MYGRVAGVLRKYKSVICDSKRTKENQIFLSRLSISQCTRDYFHGTQTVGSAGAHTNGWGKSKSRQGGNRCRNQTWKKYVRPVKHLRRRQRTFFRLAARLGLEPRQNESESFVLPLHHRAVRVFESPSWSRRWDSNPQPPVYKTGALPLSYAGGQSLHPISFNRNWKLRNNGTYLSKPFKPARPAASWWLPGDSNPEPTD